MAIRRDSIVAAVKARLEAVNTTGGYHTNLSGRVTEWSPTTRATWGIALVPAREDVTEMLTGDYWRRRLTLSILIGVDGSTSAAAVSQIIEDIYKAIGTDIKWGANAINTTPVGFDMEVDQNEKRITGATITVAIDYRTGAWQES
jgi:hypothetical protein